MGTTRFGRRYWIALVVVCGCAESHEVPEAGGDADAADAPDDGAFDDAAEAEVSPCRPGQVECSGTCVDTTSDPAHCGRCGRACAAGEVCNEGHCASFCTGGRTNCYGACVDLAVDPLSDLHEALRLLEEAKLYPRRDPAAAEEAIRHRAKPAAIVAAKLDLPGARENLDAFRELYDGDLPLFPVSAHAAEGLPEIPAFLFRTCRLMRVYAKQPGKPPDMDRPFMLHQGDTVAVLCEQIHKDFAQNLKFARIWGAHTFDGQRVIGDYVLHDKDVVELRL